MEKSKKVAGVLLAIGIAAGATLGIFAFAVFPLPPGQAPSMRLPLQDFSTFVRFQSFNSTGHNGLDFNVNASTPIVAPCDLFVTEIRCWYNDRGGHWQTNVGASMNFEWTMEIAFESWATDEPTARVQEQAIAVAAWTRVAAGAPLGTLLCEGDGAHIHFMIRRNSAATCPFQYFAPTAQAELAAALVAINHTVPVCT
ncbi:MAG: hypothetical protein JW839_09000 [Candidatus Lokiarchaeota archaeon]|nr:hypothetical protein [Candidatus Lokiarchaeota archaeon]